MHIKKRISGASSGYTLIEVLIALAIFSIGLLAMGSLQTGSMMRTNQATDMTEAMTVLADHVGVLNSMQFLDGPLVDDVTGTGFDYIDDDFTAIQPPMAGRYDVHWRVENTMFAFGTQLQAYAFATSISINATTLYPVGKTITVAVTRPDGEPLTDALSMVEFVKVWGADGP